MEEYTPFAGDRNFADDKAIVGGLAKFHGRSCVVVGHEKGADTNDRVHHNFGMARPEGYRKAQRLMTLADRFDLPVLTFVDTPGAYPGIGAEEQGQAQAIARCIDVCLSIRVPIISVIIGEGGSGGAIALATANHAVMLEHSIYSVISPEGCASILWRSADKARAAAEALRLTAQDLQNLNLIDEVVPEPVGGAHRDPSATIHTLGERMRDAQCLARSRRRRTSRAPPQEVPRDGQIGPELVPFGFCRTGIHESVDHRLRLTFGISLLLSEDTGAKRFIKPGECDFPEPRFSSSLGDSTVSRQMLGRSGTRSGSVHLSRPND